MKKIAAWALALACMLALAVPAFAEEKTVLYVGDESGLTGVFNPDADSENGDVTVAGLLTGGRLYTAGADGMYRLNETAVERVTEIGTGEGTVIYDVVLNPSQRWSDGEPVRAQDYVASYLLRSTPAYENAGLRAEGGMYLAGYWDFYESQKAFSGVHLIGEYEFTAEIAEEYAASGWRESFINAYPVRLDLVAPGVSVEETEDGAAFVSEKKIDWRAVTAAVKKQNASPSVFSGPYMLKSFDKKTGTAELILNAAYTGERPAFDTIVCRAVKAGKGAGMLEKGEIDVLMNAGRDAAALAEQGFAVSEYQSDKGYYLFFDFAKGAAASPAVRAAVTMLFDSAQLASAEGGAVLRGYYTDALYGARLAKEELEELPALTGGDKLEAVKLLEKDGWTLNAKGNKFDPSKDKVRYKKEDGKLTELKISFAYNKKDKAGADAAAILGKYLPELGAKFEKTPLDAQKYYTVMYDSANAKYNLYLHYGIFENAFNPGETYTADAELADAYDIFHVRDAALSALAAEVSAACPADGEAYKAAFAAFEARWNELVPAIPLYAESVLTVVSPAVRMPEACLYMTPGEALLCAVPAAMEE